MNLSAGGRSAFRVVTSIVLPSVAADLIHSDTLRVRLLFCSAGREISAFRSLLPATGLLLALGSTLVMDIPGGMINEGGKVASMACSMTEETRSTRTTFLREGIEVLAGCSDVIAVLAGSIEGIRMTTGSGGRDLQFRLTGIKSGRMNSGLFLGSTVSFVFMDQALVMSGSRGGGDRVRGLTGKDLFLVTSS